ncbi:hypothetical protein MHYP_G00269150 [Metynnis hypsauchen]
MPGYIGHIGPFDESVEQWSSYTERFEYFVVANRIEMEKTVSTFLSLMGAKTFTLLRSLVQPAKPGEKSYTDIVNILGSHFSPKPLRVLQPPKPCAFKTYTGERVDVKGVIETEVQLNGQTTKLPVYNVKGNYPALLGHSWLEKIRLDWPSIRTLTKQTTGLSEVLDRHSGVFKDELGMMKGIKAKLNIKPDSKPKFLKARTVPYAIMPKVEAALGDLSDKWCPGSSEHQ